MVYERELSVCLLHIVGCCLCLQAKLLIWVDRWWSFFFTDVVLFVIVNEWLLVNFLFFLTLPAIRSTSSRHNSVVCGD
jgi:hypothetical protein